MLITPFGSDRVNEQQHIFLPIRASTQPWTKATIFTPLPNKLQFQMQRQTQLLHPLFKTAHRLKLPSPETFATQHLAPEYDDLLVSETSPWRPITHHRLVAHRYMQHRTDNHSPTRIFSAAAAAGRGVSISSTRQQQTTSPRGKKELASWHLRILIVVVAAVILILAVV